MRIAFQQDFFERALLGLLKREPDERICSRACEVSQTVMDYRYKPRMGERKKFPEYARVIRVWLDTYDVLLSGTRSEFGKPDPLGRNTEVLQIKVTLPIMHTASHSI